MRAPHSSAVSATVARVVSADTGTGSLAASASTARPSRTRSSSVVTSPARYGAVDRAPTALMRAPASTMPSAVATSASSLGGTAPATEDSGLTWRAPITTTGAPPPMGTPARRARRRANTLKDTIVGKTATRQPAAAVAAGSDRSRGLLERPRAQDPRDLLAVERLTLEQRAGERVELLDVLFEDRPGPRGALEHQALDLAVDGQRRVLAVVLLTGHLAAEEDVLFVLAEGQRAELVRHAPLADHLARHLGGLLEVVAGARRLLLEDDLLGRPAAEQDRDAVQQVVPRVVVLVIQG